MSTVTAETIVDEKLKDTDNSTNTFKDKGLSCKQNGYLKETNSKEYFLEIIKEVIKEEVPEDEEDNKTSTTNVVINKDVKIKDELDVNGETTNSNTVFLTNGCISSKESALHENDNESDAILSLASQSHNCTAFDSAETKKSCLGSVSPCSLSVQGSNDSASCNDSKNTESKLDNINSNENSVANGLLKNKSVHDASPEEQSQINPVLDIKESSCNLSSNCSTSSREQTINDNLSNSSTINDTLVKKEDVIQKLPNLSTSDVKTCDVDSSNNTDTSAEIPLRDEFSEGVVVKHQTNNNTEEMSCSVTDLPNNEVAIESSSCTMEDGNQHIESTLSENSSSTLKNNTSLDKLLSKNNSTRDASHEKDSYENTVDKRLSLDKENPVEGHSSIETLSSEETVLKQDNVISDTGCVASSSESDQPTNLEKTDLLVTVTPISKQSDQPVAENSLPPPVSDSENLIKKTAETKESSEVSSSKNDEQPEKIGINLQKRPSSPDNGELGISKKIKLTDSESSSKRRNSEENLPEFTNESKKLRSSDNNSTMYESEGDVIIDGIVSVQDSEVEVNKENNENRSLVIKAEEKKKVKLDKIKKKKSSKEKLKNKELNKTKDKKEKETSDIKSTNLPVMNDKVSEKTNESEGTSENRNLNSTKLGTLKLKKRKSLDQHEEYELLNSTGQNKCPLCSCGCKIQKVDRKIFGEKTRTFMDVFESNKDNININLIQKLEELVGQTVVDWTSNKCDVGIVRKRAHFLEEEHDRLIQLTINLKKQLDDARCIMKRMIDEKIAQKSWVDGIMPLKVTRSVGLQVCTTGSAHVLIKAPENEKELSHLVRKNSVSNTSTTSTDSRTNSISMDISKVSNEVITSNSCSKDLRQKETSSVECNPNSTTVVLAVAVQSFKDGTSTDNAKKTPQSASTNQRPETCDVEDDLEIQVIEPAPNSRKSTQLVANTTQSLPTTSNISSNSVIASVVTTTSGTTVTTVATTVQNTPTIHVLKPADVMAGQQARIARQATTSVPPAVTSASEVIDLTDNDSVTWATPKTGGTMNPANRLGGPTPLRTPSVQTVAKQNTFNFNGAANNVTGTNKVVTFPADSTTTYSTASYLVQRPANQPTTMRKAVIQTPPSSGSEMITSMSTLPPLPRGPKYAPDLPRPPKPHLRICKNSSGIMLSWNFNDHIPTTIRKYQVFAYQEGTPIDSNKTELWKKVGDVDALPLPMACTLTQFKEGHKYFFVVRAMDVNMRLGDFSSPGSIMLTSTTSPLLNSGHPRV